MSKFYSQVMKLEDGSERVVAYGVATLTLPCLAKSRSGKWVLPILRMDEKGNLNNWFSIDGEPVTLYNISRDNTEFIWSQPILEGKTSEKAFYIIVPKINGTTEFFKIEAWNQYAKFIHMNVEKGDEVIIVAKKKVQKSPATSRDETLWVIEFIKKIEKFQKKENENESEEEDDEEDVPF